MTTRSDIAYWTGEAELADPAVATKGTSGSQSVLDCFVTPPPTSTARLASWPAPLAASTALPGIASGGIAGGQQIPWLEQVLRQAPLLWIWDQLDLPDGTPPEW